ncbi:putative sulfate exporter family transporter [Georgenia yuyongxinii]|uniref:Putative sulfate exporter family transporter n=1 Tax=Georgenia yuyongxinii TaxID=2589797 RepID=A0A5B8C247_9MICO|nr:putative sulfate exporter family transporter [Georgenia yuyongxinii]
MLGPVLPTAATWLSRAPGLLLTTAVALVAFAVHSAVPVVSALLVAIVIGVILRNAGWLPAAAEPGVRYSARTVLRLGVVLLGLQLSIPEVVALGWEAIVVIVATVTLTWCFTLLVGRWLRVPRALRMLLATGTAICGASAVAAMSAVLGEREPTATPAAPAAVDAAGEIADDEDVEDAAATAVAAVTVFGTLSMLVLPTAAAALGLGDHAAGVWVGAGIHEVGQVVAAGGVLGPTVLATAVVTKLGRVVLLAPLVAGVGYARSRRARVAVEHQVAVDSASVVTGAAPTGVTHTRPPLVPGFVLGFLALVAVRSLLPVPAVVLDVVETAATLLLTVAMVALGTGVNLTVLLRRGGPAMLLGLVAALLAAGISLLGVLTLL